MPRGAKPKPPTRKKNTSLVLFEAHEKALDERAGELGITRSDVAREILDQWLRLGRPPLERGYMAGWRAGYREFMRQMGEVNGVMLSALENGEVTIGGLDENP